MSEEPRKLLSAATSLPWEYRPYEHDDWGYIRGPEVEWSIGPVKPVVAISREGDTESDHNAHRRNKTDPYEPNGRLIVAAVNALPTLLDRIAELEAALRPFAESDIDVSGTAAIGITARDILRARSALTLSGADGEGK